MAKAKVERFDGWQNAQTGMGMQGFDKSMQTKPTFSFNNYATLEAIYSTETVAQKVVKTIVEDSLREGWKLVSKNESSTETISFIDQFVKSHSIIEKIEEAWTYARVYGGAALILGINDGRPMHEPVDWNASKGIQFAFVVDRFELSYQSIERDPRKKSYGLPNVYRYSPLHGGYFGNQNGQFSNSIHRSRMIIFQGKNLTKRMLTFNQYWHYSELHSVIEAIEGFATAHKSAVHFLHDFSHGVMKMKGLDSAIAAQKGKAVESKLAKISQNASIYRTLVIDADDDYTRVANSVAGISELITAATQRLITDSDLPSFIVLGDGAKGGLGSEGALEQRQWYDRVSATQEKYLKPKLTQLFKIILASNGGEKEISKLNEIDIEFNSLWQQDDSQIAATRKAIAETDAIYMQNGVLDPEEVRQSRFGNEKFSFETTIEKETNNSNEELFEENLTPGAGSTTTETILNGAQITSAIGVIAQVHAGEITKDAAKILLIDGLGFTKEQAEAMVKDENKTEKTPEAPTQSIPNGAGTSVPSSNEANAPSV